jgi:hypothetical protein
MKTILAIALSVRYSVLAQGRMLVSFLPVTGAFQTIDELVSIRPGIYFFSKRNIYSRIKYSPRQVNARLTPLCNDIVLPNLRLRSQELLDFSRRHHWSPR